MASTRNKNNKADYKVLQNQSLNIFKHNTYYGKNNHNDTSFFELGSNPSFKRDQLSHNNVDVESMLRGIRSTNLEGPSFSATPEPKTIKTKPLFERPVVFIPPPFEHSIVERPLYLF